MFARLTESGKPLFLGQNVQYTIFLTICLNKTRYVQYTGTKY